MPKAIIDKSSFTYESDAKASFLVFKVEGEEKILHYQVEMINNNLIPTILPLHIRNKNSQVFCLYNITSKQRLAQAILRKQLSRREFLNLIEGIAKTILQASNYLLSDNGFLIDEDYIYINPNDLQISLVYLPIPIDNYSLQDKLKILISKLVSQVATEESCNDNFIHRILVAVNSDTFNLVAFHKLILELYNINYLKNLQEEKLMVKTPILNNPVKMVLPFKYKLVLGLGQLLILVVVLLLFLQLDLFRSFDIASVFGIGILFVVAEYILFKRLLIKYKLVDKTKAKMEKNTKTSANLNMNKKEIHNHPSIEQHSIEGPYNDDTDIIFNSIDNDTMLLDVAAAITQPYLSAIRDGIIEKITINKPSFVIGKIKEQADYVLLNKAISRIHAEIIHMEGNYYIVDLNSKNGTYVNGIRLASNKPQMLEDGSLIKLADKEYTFNIGN